MIKLQIYKKLIKNPTKNILTVDGQHRKVRQVSLIYTARPKYVRIKVIVKRLSRLDCINNRLLHCALFYEAG